MLCPLAEIYLSGGPQDTKTPCHFISDTLEQLYLTSVYAIGEWWHNCMQLCLCVCLCMFGNNLKFIARRPRVTPILQSASEKSAPDHTNMSLSLLTFLPDRKPLVGSPYSQPVRSCSHARQTSLLLSQFHNPGAAKIANICLENECAA